jgi:hypothetical protein
LGDGRTKWHWQANDVAGNGGTSMGGGTRALPKTSPHLTLYEPATYAIRVQGALEANWSERLGDQAVTELSGRLPDQAGLIGVLTSLYDLGMPLLSGERVTIT